MAKAPNTTQGECLWGGQDTAHWMRNLVSQRWGLLETHLNSTHFGTSKQYEMAQSWHEKRKLNHYHPKPVGEGLHMNV